MPFSAPLMQVIGDVLFAVRQGQGIWRWVSDYVPGIVAWTVLTNGPAAGGQPGIYYNLAVGERVILTGMRFGVTTINDHCHFEVGYTDQPNGAGTFTPLTGHHHIYTGAAIAGYLESMQTFSTPKVASYAAGARSVTYRVLVNDATCEITCSWHGWAEPE